MILSKRYTLLAYSLFRKQAETLEKHFRPLKMTIQKANMGVALDEYTAAYVLTNVLLLPLVALVAVVWAVTFAEAGIIGTIVWVAGAVLLAAAGVFVFFLAYPQYEVNSLKNALDKHVAFASTHMATVAGTGVPPHVIFQMMGQFNEYGEVAKECRSISQNIAVFGYDTISAISEVAQRTPSYKFKDLLWSVVATIRTGGDLRVMLMGKSKSLMEEQRRTEAKYVETLSMFAEIYSTVFVAGVVIIFVMVSIMGILGGLPVPVKLVLQATTYFGVPLASVMFIFLIESSKPSGV